MQNSKLKSIYKLIPSLFGKSEKIPTDWDFHKLSEIGEIIGGGTPNTTKEEYWNGKILWAVPTDITDLSDIFIGDTKRNITSKGLKESSANLLPKGTILVTSRATVGECAIALKQIATNQGFQNIVCYSQNDNLFIFYSIKFNKKRLLRLAYGTTFLEVSKTEMKKVSFPIPENTKEQEKIASILFNVDSLINHTKREIEKTQRFRKGLIQKLLIRGIGHTKFKKVNWFFGKKLEIPEKWKITQLSKLAKVVDSRHYTPKYVENGYRLVLPNNITENGLDLSNTKFVSKKSYLGIIEGDRKPEEGDMTYTRNASFGTGNIVKKDQIFCLGQDLVLIKPQQMHPYLLFVIMNSKIIHTQLDRLVTGSTFKRINLEFIRNFSIISPQDPVEELKIATIIINIDNEIEMLQKKQTQLETLKKGLMQKLLTGQIRVKV